MRDCDVVVLSRFPEIFQGFRDSLNVDPFEVSQKIAILDHGRPFDIAHDIYSQWIYGSTGKAFQMSGNANFGWRIAKGDILYAGDDTRIVGPDTIKRLRELAHSDPTTGILSPRIIGHAQELQMRPTESPITWAPYVAFVFVYIKREVIEAIGYLDESFEGYGVEDIDFCVRARKAGFKIGVAHDIAVTHGIGKYTYGSTFLQVRGAAQMAKDDAANWDRFAEKYGLEKDRRKIFEFIGNLC